MIAVITYFRKNIDDNILHELNKRVQIAYNIPQFFTVIMSFNSYYQIIRNVL